MQAGVRLLPFVCLMVFSAILSGALMPKTGHYMPWYVAGSLLVTLGSGLMRKSDSSSHHSYKQPDNRQSPSTQTPDQPESTAIQYWLAPV
jgi:hypothetical protein